MEGISTLKGWISKRLKPKTLNDQPVNGPMLIELAEAYCEAINTGRVPTIESAWDYVC